MDQQGHYAADYLSALLGTESLTSETINTYGGDLSYLQHPPALGVPSPVIQDIQFPPTKSICKFTENIF